MGLAATALGAAFGIKAIVDNDATLRLCPNDACPTDEGIARNKDARTAALVADISLPVGLVAAGAGVLLLVTSKPSAPAAAPQRAARPPRPTGAAVSLVPAVGPGGGSLSVRGAW